MNRRIRIPFKIAATLSLLLCITSIFFWLVSHTTEHVWLFRSRTSTYHLAISRGDILFWCDAAESSSSNSISHFTVVPPVDWINQSTFDTRWNRIGFGYRNDSSYSPAILLPMWLITILTAAPIVWMARKRWAKRSRPGLCASCGYDLRATPERCPECGTVPGEKA